MERFLQTNTLSGKSHGRMRKYYYSCTAHFSTIIVPNDKKQARKRPFYRLLRAFENYSNSISETISSSYIMFLKLHVVSYIRYFHVFFCVIEENADIFMTLTSKVIIAQEQKERQWNFEYFQAFYCFWGHCRIFTFAFRVFF